MRGIREGWTRHPWEWLLLLAGVAVLVSAVAAPHAHGSFHLLKLREVFPGTEDSGDDAFVELQMYAPGQNFVGNDNVCLRWYVQSNGSDFDADCLPDDVSSGQNQRTILVGDDAVLEADHNSPDLSKIFLASSGAGGFGAVCVLFADEITPADCVSWGAFTGADPLDSPPPGNAGTPAAPDGIPDGMSLTRSIARGCPTLLELGDDTDDSATDFLVTTPSPRNNAGAITEMPCAPGGGGAIVRCGGLNATRTGNAGANLLVGTPARDVIAGLGGRDTIRGLAGNDVLCGGNGRDKLVGGGGRDRLLGQAGRDTCKGGPKRDVARTCEVKRTI